MIKIVTIHKPGVRDHEGTFRKPFEPFETTSKQFAWLAQRSPRSVYELETLLAMIDSERTHEGTLRQIARNASLDATGELPAVRARLRTLLASPAAPEVKTVLTPAPPEPEPPEAPAPPEPPAPEPLVPPEHIAPEAWDRLLAAWDTQDYKAARSALASLSDDPTPSKATELWEAVEALLRDHGMLK